MITMKGWSPWKDDVDHNDDYDDDCNVPWVIFWGFQLYPFSSIAIALPYWPLALLPYMGIVIAAPYLIAERASIPKLAKIGNISALSLILSAAGKIWPKIDNGLRGERGPHQFQSIWQDTTQSLLWVADHLTNLQTLYFIWSLKVKCMSCCCSSISFSTSSSWLFCTRIIYVKIIYVKISHSSLLSFIDYMKAFLKLRFQRACLSVGLPWITAIGHAIAQTNLSWHPHPVWW